MINYNKDIFQGLSKDLLTQIAILMYTSAASDNEVTDDEIKIVNSILIDDFNFSPDEAKEIADTFSIGNLLANVSNSASIIRNENNSALIEEVLILLQGIIDSDGEENAEGAVFNVIKSELLGEDDF